MIGWLFIFGLIGVTENSRTIQAVKTGTPPVIDGLIEPVWAQGDSAKNFTDSWPVEDKPASESTTVYLLADDQNLYVAFRCYDNPSKIEAWVTLRDNGWGDDVSLVLAPFGDKTTGYKFSVNARNVQVDMVLTSDGRESDLDWDGVWYSATKITDYGYAVEMKIPFKSIRYRPGLNDWGINFKRSITRTSEQSWWTPVKQNEGVRLSKAGVVTGIKPVSRGLNVEAYPVGLLRYEKNPPRDPVINPDGGFDLNWYPSGATGLQVTTNPDFAQIEADPYVINLSKYELYLTERRPFFTEGAEIFKPATDVDLFYSRRIGKRLPDGQEVPIWEGTKFTTRFERFNVGLLAAVTGPVRYTDYSGSERQEPQSYYSVVRIKRSILENSALGILYAGKDWTTSSTADNYNRVFGVDGVFRTSTVEIDWGGARSGRSGATGDYAGKFGFNWLEKSFFLWAGATKVGKGFDISEIGYVPWPGSENYYVAPGLQFYQKGIVRYCSISGSAGVSREAGDPGYGQGFGLGVNPEFTNNWSMNFSVDGGRTYEQAEWYNFSEASLSGGTDWAKPIALSLSGWWIDKTPYYRSGAFNHFAPEGSGDATLVWKPNPSLNFEVEVNPTVEFDAAGRVERVDWIFRPRLGYAITNDLYLRIYAEPNLETQIHNINILLAWNFKPKSWLYFAVNESRDNTVLDERLRSRVVVLKAKYLFSL